MDYSLAGFTFHFDLDTAGRVVSITTPNIPVGPFTIAGEVLNFDPAITVEAAESVVYAILALFGIV